MIYATAISFEENDAKTVKKIVRIKLETDGNDSWKYKDKPFNINLNVGFRLNVNK